MVFLRFLLVSSILFCACQEKSTDRKSQTGVYFYSFEGSLEGWEPRGIDLELGDSLLAWSIEPAQEMAKDGSSALKFYLENYNDAGKIWIERPFVVQPNNSYEVVIAYHFASADFGMANLWTLIAGVLPQSPATRDDLVYQGHTGNGFDEDMGFVWLDKSYDFRVTADDDGHLYVIAGIWGTWETPRTYYLDCLSVVISESSR